MDSPASPLHISNPLSCGRLTIDLDAYADNWRFLNEQSGTAECAAMVKADAYGISISQAIGALEKAGCKTFFVATPQEGLAVRQISSSATVYILNGLLPGCIDIYKNNDLSPVLNSLVEVEEWQLDSGGASAALHIDTGMNRLGLREEEAKALAEKTNIVADLNLALIMSHLACADTPRSLMNGCQLSSFKEICAFFPGVPRSLCNSGGIFHGSAFHMEMVRPGIALYGGAGLQDHLSSNPMKSVVKVEARILQIRDVLEHESVGYGAAEIMNRDCKIAILGAGYADGYIRAAGSTTKTKGAKVWVKGQSAPLVGRVSMDLIAVDVTDIPGIQRGDYVELFGPNVSISHVANAAQTIDYEFLTGLGKRYERVYGPVET